MDNERYELEKELIAVDKRLEKEKGKRTIIMIFLYSILCGFVFSVFIENFVGLIVISFVSGTILFFITIYLPDAITNLFTDITHLQSRKSALEEKLKTIQIYK